MNVALAWSIWYFTSMLTDQDRRQQHRAIEATRKLRVKNLRALEQLLGGWATLSRHTGKSASFLTALAGPNPRREIGETLARDIEAALNLDAGWLDQNH
ncbi:MAG TPA: hypothetical protein VMQ76_12395 [Terracidiphilus sp.]|nr:hypothetical protein [Terracidiphilus sp.]